MQLFSEKVAEQTEDLAQVYEATEEAVQSVDEGLLQLMKAAKASKTSANLQFTAIIVLTLILIILDNFVL